MLIHLILIVEDQLSDTVARKMLEETGKNYEVANVVIWNKDKIKKEIKQINKAANNQVYFVLTDQDTNNRCPPDAIRELPGPVNQNLFYRFAVMEVESWVMAHRESISKFLSVPVNRIPMDTDTIINPKEHLINLARKSRSKRIRDDIAPRNNSTSRVGPDYNGRLGQFVSEYWDVRTASQCSPSLRRSFRRLENFTPTFPS